MAAFTSVVRKVHIYGSMPAVALALVFAATSSDGNAAGGGGADKKRKKAK
jgi:hypothetical protein